MNHYHQIISAATGVTIPADLDDIEDSMRRDIFHSTLDWQTRRQLMKGAREAWVIVRIMRDPEVLAQAVSA